MPDVLRRLNTGHMTTKMHDPTGNETEAQHQDSHPTMICLYPSNITIQRRSVLSGARDAGIHDLKGMDGVCAGAIITDKAQAHCSSYPGMGVL